MIEEEFDFNRFNKNLATIDDKENYEPKTKFENEDQKIACILSKIRCAFHYFLSWYQYYYWTEKKTI